MTSNQRKLEALKEQLKELKKKHNLFYTQIMDLNDQINKLSESIGKKSNVILDKKTEKPTPVVVDKVAANIKQPSPVKKKAHVIKPPKEKVDLESFIGKNIIAKIGILITVIGVAIGGKYAIDNNLISPLTRIILGYIFGIGLVITAIKLKEKYESFSAVLLSGAMAIFYFITYFAYNLYDLFPQTLTFLLMSVFTVFTVLSAVHYKRQVIAILGLVGAYAIPFFLSNDSGNVLVLFSYMTIINIGIMFVAFKQYWKPLYYTAFSITWLIYIIWVANDYSREDHFTLALSFAFIFFLIFYATFLTYKLIRKEEFNKGDIVLLLFNSFIYYGIGYGLLSNHETGQYLLGIFTVFNAIIHFVVGSIVYKKSNEKKGLFYTVFGLVLVFLTIAVPVQLDGNWVTLFWICEAALLYWIGVTKQIKMYKTMSYPILGIAVISLFQDWTWAYDKYSEEFITPILNIQFLTSIIFIIALAFISYIHFKKAAVNEKYYNLVSICITSVLLLITYNTFKLEITNYFNRLDFNFTKLISNDEDDYYYSMNYYGNYEFMWVLNYTLLFVSIFSFLNIKKWKMKIPANINSIVNVLLTFIFLAGGLYVLSELRKDFLNHQDSDFVVTGYAIALRYVSFIFLGILIYATYLYVKQYYTHQVLKKSFKLFLVFVIFWILSSELLHWLDMSGFKSQYKLSLSILWGIYALLLVGYGIWKRYKAIRIAGIAIFSITLVKLFFYDIAHLSSISKVIVFISLGLLLLIMSYLYNKYTSIITDEENK